ncbi:MAG: bifunctional nuclease family protein [Planctomycetota bacterium]
MERTEARVNRLILVDGHEQQYLQLRERDGLEPRELTMVIGRAAAQEITNVLQGEGTPRPQTHELAFGILTGLSGHIEETVIHELDQGTYYAELRISRGPSEETLGIDCRPSDAIALSLRGSAPIFVTEKVWTEVAQS